MLALIFLARILDFCYFCKTIFFLFVLHACTTYVSRLNFYLFNICCHCGRKSIQIMNFVSKFALLVLIFVAKFLESYYFWVIIFQFHFTFINDTTFLRISKLEAGNLHGNGSSHNGST